MAISVEKFPAQGLKTTYLFCSFHFWFLVFWSLLVTKLQKYYVIFVYILQDKVGKMEKSQKENHETKVTKIPKTKRRKYGMNETKLTTIFTQNSPSRHLGENSCHFVNLLSL